MIMKNPYFTAAGAFLAAWQIGSFALDYRSILGALLAGVFGYLPPKSNRVDGSK